MPIFALILQKFVKKHENFIQPASQCRIRDMRQRRMLREGAEYHVIAKVNRGEPIFNSYEDWKLFMGVLKRAKKKFKFTIKNFCIARSRVHLLIKPTAGECLSKIMQWLLGVFAQLWNKKHQKTGHLWGDRFFSRIIRGLLDLLRLFLHLGYNRVALHPAGESRKWAYGGFWHHRK